MKSLLALQLIVALAAVGCGVNEGPVGTPGGELGASYNQIPSGPVGQDNSGDTEILPDNGAAGGSGSRGDLGAIELPKSIPHDAATLAKNCEKLQAAVRQFAAHCDGRFPRDVDGDMSMEGKTVLDYLPGGRTLYNTYEDVWAAPVAHTADTPGDVGYVLMDEVTTYKSQRSLLGPAYIITGFGEHSVDVALSNLELSLVEAVVFSNCRTMQVAVAKWSASAGGLYPADVSANATSDGRTLTDFLPHGCYMLNPATRCLTEPVDGCAVNCGESGYVPVCINGWNLGYVISGVGSEAGREIIMIAFSPEHE